MSTTGPVIEMSGPAPVVAGLIAGLVVDLTGDPSGWPAWHAAGSRVVAVAATEPGYEPEGITVLAGDVRDRVTVQRVCDQTAGRTVTGMVVNPDDLTALPYHVRLGGRVVVRREAGSQTFYELWR